MGAAEDAGWETLTIGPYFDANYASQRQVSSPQTMKHKCGEMKGTAAGSGREAAAASREAVKCRVKMSSGERPEYKEFGVGQRAEHAGPALRK